MSASFTKEVEKSRQVFPEKIACVKAALLQSLETWVCYLSPDSIFLTSAPACATVLPVLLFSQILQEATRLTLGGSLPVIIISLQGWHCYVALCPGLGGTLELHQSCSSQSPPLGSFFSGLATSSPPLSPCQGLTCTCAKTSFVSLLTWWPQRHLRRH